jgi:hypothetical protein
VKRFKAVQQAKQEFWDRWVKEVFPSLLKQLKWYKYKRDAKVGDIVLRKDETEAGQTYKYVRVTNVHIGTDGKVRAADIEYKVPRESKFRTTTSLIHKLVLVILVEEQTMEEKEKQGGQERNEEGQEKEDEAPRSLRIGEEAEGTRRLAELQGEDIMCEEADEKVLKNDRVQSCLWLNHSGRQASRTRMKRKPCVMWGKQ